MHPWREGSITVETGDGVIVSIMRWFVIHPSSMMRTHQRRWCASRHPRRMTRPFNVTSQLVALKKTLQQASQRTATESRLLVRPGRLCAILASEGRLPRSKSTVCVDRICLPLGWTTVMAVELVGRDVVVEGMTSDFEAAVSMNAVEDRSGGLAQLGS